MSGTRRSIFLVAALALLFSAGFLYLRWRREPIAPSVPLIAGCKPLQSGMRRMGDHSGYQFDASMKVLRITEGATDAPPLQHGFHLQPEDSNSALDILFGPANVAGAALDPATTFLKHLSKRNIVDRDGRDIGEDEWGYLDTGERWRQVRLPGVIANYGLVNAHDADLFDVVLSSACFLPPQTS